MYDLGSVCRARNPASADCTRPTQMRDVLWAAVQTAGAVGLHGVGQQHGAHKGHGAGAGEAE